MTERTHEERLEALLALLPLDDLPRTGWVLRGVVPAESVAGHTLGVAQVVLALGPLESPAIDLGTALGMAIVHDAPEALTGDLPQPAARHLPAGAKAAMESAIAQDLLGPLSQKAMELYESLEAQACREARFVKLADRIQLGVRLAGYQRAGHRGLDEFVESLARLASGPEVEEFPAAAAFLQTLLNRARSAQGSPNSGAKGAALGPSSDAKRP